MIFKVIFGSEIHVLKSTDKQKFHQLLSCLPTIFKSLPARFKLSYLDEQGDEITFEDQNDYDVLLGTGLKSVKIIIRENCEDFIEMTNEIHIDQHQQDIIEQEISEIKHAESKPINDSVRDIDESLIEEKIKMMMPHIISKIKAEITDQLKEKSKASIRNQPTIVEEPNFKKNEKKVQDKTQTKSSIVVHRGITCDGCQFRNIEGVRYKCAVCPDFDFCQRCEATVEHAHPFLKIKTLKQTPLKILTVLDQDDAPSVEVNGQRYGVPPSFEGLLNHGIGMMQGFFGRQNCAAFRNRCQAAKEEWNKSWNCAQKEQEKQEKCPEQKKVEVKKEEPKVQKKEQPKVEKKVEDKPKKEEMKPKLEEKPKTADNDVIKRNANYLVEVFGYQYERCLRWAQMYPYMTKQELLNFCLTQPSFFS